MPDLIIANRNAVSDRSPVAAFTVRTDRRPGWFEVAVATQADLFTAGAKSRRSCANFYSSRASGAIAAPNGEGAFVLSPDVLALFEGQTKLYYALATFSSVDRTGASLMPLPTPDGPFITLPRSLTRRAAGPTNCPPETLQWAGDGAAIDSPVPAGPAAPAGSGPVSFSKLDVPLIAQTPGMSCWAAAAAMVAAWRDGVGTEAGSVMKSFGTSAKYLPQGLRPQTIAELCAAWKLVELPRVGRSAADLAALLGSHGPLWVGNTSSDRAVVVTGVSGDGSRDATTVELNDPWPVGSGAGRSARFGELVRDFSEAGGAADPAQERLTAPLVRAERN